MQVVRFVNTLYVIISSLELVHGITTANSDLETFSHEGCFQELTNNFYLRLTKFDMTLNRCYMECSYVNAKYMGLKYGTDCYCGFTFNYFNKVEEERCNLRCNGNEQERCGSYFFTSIYGINIPATYEPIEASTTSSYLDNIVIGKPIDLMRGLLIFFVLVLFIVASSYIMLKRTRNETSRLEQARNSNIGVEFNSAFSDPISVVDQSAMNTPNTNDLPSYDEAVKGKY